MAEATMRFDFETEFKGTVVGEAKQFQTLIDEIVNRPLSFIECAWDLRQGKAEASVQGDLFVIKIAFTILLTDDEDLLSDGSYTNDMVDIWQNDFPRGELTLNIGGQAQAPASARCTHVH